MDASLDNLNDLDDNNLRNMVIKGKNQGVRKKYLEEYDKRNKKTIADLVAYNLALENRIKTQQRSEIITIIKEKEEREGNIISLYIYLREFKEKKVCSLVIKEFKMVTNFAFYCKSLPRAQISSVIEVINLVRAHFANIKSTLLIRSIHTNSDYLHSLHPSNSSFTGFNKDGNATKNSDLIIVFRELLDKIPMRYISDDYLLHLLSTYTEANYIQELHRLDGWRFF